MFTLSKLPASAGSGAHGRVRKRSMNRRLPGFGLGLLLLSFMMVMSCDLAIERDGGAVTLDPLRPSVLEQIDDGDLSVHIALYRSGSLDALSREGTWIVHPADQPTTLDGEDYVEVPLDSEGSVTLDEIRPDSDYRVLLAVYDQAGFAGVGAVSARFTVSPGETTQVEVTLGSLAYAVPFETRLDAGFFHSVYLDASGQLWGWGGFEEYYAIGLDPPPEEPQRIDVEAASSFRSVAASESHSVFADAGGQVLGVGQNWYQTLGDEDANLQREEPAPIEGVDGVANLRSDYFQMLALTEGGDVYSWGLEYDYLLGREFDETPHYTPGRITGNGFEDRTIVHVAAGEWIGAAIDAENQLWLWGNNSDGRLGIHPEQDYVVTPQLVEVGGRDADPVEFVSVDAGTSHVVALAIDGTVYAWGRNDSGQVGLGHTESPVTEPSVVGAVDSAVYVAATINTSFAVDRDGTVWSWGSNSGGKLAQGDDDTQRIQEEPQRIDGLSDIVEIRGHYDHTLARDGDGNVYSWGFDYSNQLGRDVPEELEEEEFDPAPGVVDLP